jgi:5,10-methenyltetrahydrofolate synthetase
MRRLLLARREAFAASAEFSAATQSLGQHLYRVLGALEPEVLGLYWAMRCEFNAPAVLQSLGGAAKPPLGATWSLPFAQRSPVQMHYRVWDGAAPRVRDGCGIPASDGAPVVPDVVLVPCVGYTPAGDRLGYGGGYFDRWLAAHRGVTAVGVAWAAGELDAADCALQAHDQRLDLIVTEHGVA